MSPYSTIRVSSVCTDGLLLNGIVYGFILNGTSPEASKRQTYNVFRPGVITEDILKFTQQMDDPIFLVFRNISGAIDTLRWI